MTSETDFVSCIAGVAQALLGEPNKRLSDAKQMRFGTHGGLAVDLATGTWYDHEHGQGGGVLHLIEREKGLKGHAAVEWIERWAAQRR
jgi:hypothetical protein